MRQELSCMPSACRGAQTLATYSDHAPDNLGACLPEIVPAVTPCMSDTKKQVKDAAISAMTGTKDM